MRNVLKLGTVSDEDVESNEGKKDLDFLIQSGYFDGTDDDCQTYEED